MVWQSTSVHVTMVASVGGTGNRLIIDVVKTLFFGKSNRLDLMCRASKEAARHDRRVCDMF